MREIRMVDLLGQYEKIKSEIDQAIQEVLNTTAFINGPQVKSFKENLQQYLKANHVIPCGNGTDALQIALMALDIKKGSEIILPAFNYVATAEVIALLDFKPVFVDVDPDTFNINVDQIEKKITDKTAAIMAVHLFGQCANMEKIMELAIKHDLFIIEDNAQSIGAVYTFNDGKKQTAGTIGHVGTTSFFPSKNLGCMGDGGAIYTNDGELAETIQVMANHGQKKKYAYELVGVNSRLDTVQAAILEVKLKNLDQYIAARQKAAAYYDDAFKGIKEIQIPKRNSSSTHVFHQYTLKVKGISRNELQKSLESMKIPSMIYYPSPLHLQNAYVGFGYKEGDFPVAESLCKNVISLPMHTELDEEQLEYIVEGVNEYLNRNF
ncbi:MAG TPA: DegT/DnrJ/EryC1/StrS family aminotransferase [Cytophagales bacterium]|nr:DegT/DnrJ/EryC1/StrS family aminotransferase [Cytophagales bacterium]